MNKITKYSILCLLLLSACGSPSATPEPTIDLKAVQDTAVAKAWGYYTQTAAAIPTNTQTFIPLPTSTIEPTNTVGPTFTSVPTLTPIPLPTNTLVVFFPTSAPPAGVCSCSGDTLNCSDFSSHASAQACHDYCISVGRGDIHRLDNDGDGDACESL